MSEVSNKAKKKILIIGGVAGGATAAARARREDEDADITILERGHYVSFANCGLPYYIGRDIKNRQALLLQTPEGFWSRYRVKALTQTEALKILPQKKQVLARGPQGECSFEYDKLIISQGAQAIVPPLPGGTSSHVFSLRDMNDMDKIDKFLDVHQAKSVVVVGGGFIGIEMVEAFFHRGLRVHLIEKANHVMSLMDPEFSLQIQDHLTKKGIRLLLGTSLVEIDENKKRARIEDGSWIDADMVLFSIGVRPELKLIQDAGLEVGETGALVVNEYLQTSDPDIYAVGDMIEITHRLSRKKAKVPLAGPANRQGRIVAQNAVSDRCVSYHGAIGTSVVKIFDFTAASTGLSEKQARALSLNLKSVTIHPRHHAGYYPGAQQLSLKLLFDPTTGLIWGAQAFGRAGVEKRIDVIATAIHGSMTIYDLEELDLCYAPPYSSANDPVNMAGFVASNVARGFTKVITGDEFFRINKEGSKLIVVDVRENSELAGGVLAGSVHIPLGELRERLHELDPSAQIFVHCAVGYRGHLAYRILTQNGYPHVANISGGYRSLELFSRL